MAISPSASRIQRLMVAAEMTSSASGRPVQVRPRHPPMCPRGNADFTPTPSMHARLDLASAVLADGRVLIADGEFFDPDGDLDNVSFGAGRANDRSARSPCDTVDASRTSRSRRERIRHGCSCTG